MNQPETLKPGLYLSLYHGRTNPEANMEDWGDDGPTIGPLKYVQTTYCAELKLEFVDPKDFQKFFPGELTIDGLRVPAGSDPYAKHPSYEEVVADPEKYVALGYTLLYRTLATIGIAHDMAYFEGMYYGDWTVHVQEGQGEPTKDSHEPGNQTQ